MAVVAHIYERSGWSLEPEAVRDMERWLDEQHDAVGRSGIGMTSRTMA